MTEILTMFTILAAFSAGIFVTLLSLAAVYEFLHRRRHADKRFVAEQRQQIVQDAVEGWLKVLVDTEYNSDKNDEIPWSIGRLLVGDTEPIHSLPSPDVFWCAVTGCHLNFFAKPEAADVPLMQVDLKRAFVELLPHDLKDYEYFIK